MHQKHCELVDGDAIDREILPGAGAMLRVGGASETLDEPESLLPPDVVDLIVLAIDDPFERARVAVAVRSMHVLRLLAKQQPKLLDWTPETLCTASSEGAVELLAFLRRRQEALGRPCPVEAGWQQSWYPMDAASRGGHVDVLQWWKESGLELKWSNHAMNAASRSGHVAVLQWWKESGLEVKWSEYAMDEASGNGYINVLRWWKESGFDMKWSGGALYGASKHGRVAVLQWWKESGLYLRLSSSAMDWASWSGHVDVLQWWKDSGLELRWSEKAMDLASEFGRVGVLEWWKESGLETKWSAHTRSRALVSDYHFAVRNWWRLFAP
jgi:hypothetical protein